MVKLFRALVFQYRLKNEIRIADLRKRLTGKKHFVINLCGRPLCVSKERVRSLIEQKVYRPDVKVADIAAVAIYKTK